MDLFLFRHGIAEDSAGGPGADRDRQLTKEGRDKVRVMARKLKNLGLAFDEIWHSPFVRARETAEIVAEVFEAISCLRGEALLLPGEPADKLATAIRREIPEKDSLLLVGHEPGLSLLASYLLCGELGLSIELKKSAVCKLALSARGSQLATLQWLVSPKLMVCK